MGQIHLGQMGFTATVRIAVTPRASPLTHNPLRAVPTNTRPPLPPCQCTAMAMDIMATHTIRSQCPRHMFIIRRHCRPLPTAKPCAGRGGVWSNGAAEGTT